MIKFFFEKNIPGLELPAEVKFLKPINPSHLKFSEPVFLRIVKPDLALNSFSAKSQELA